jgi:predicted phage-related endonuclease
VLNRGFFWFRIEADVNEQAALIGAEKAFWEGNVLAQIPPEPDGSDATDEAVKALGNRCAAPTGDALLYDMDGQINHLMTLQNDIKALQTGADAIRQKLMLAMGENAYGKSGVAKISYLSQERRTVDCNALQSRYPQAYADCLKMTTNRVLRVAALKGE